MSVVVRGIRGAITAQNNEICEIHAATKELLIAMLEQNEVTAEQIASCFITVTPDLDVTFPARAVRDMSGWDLVPLMCALEVPVPGSLPQCIRLLLHVNTDKGQEEIRHVYMREAVNLRPDLQQK